MFTDKVESPTPAPVSLLPTETEKYAALFFETE